MKEGFCYQALEHVPRGMVRSLEKKTGMRNSPATTTCEQVALFLTPHGFVPPLCRATLLRLPTCLSSNRLTSGPIPTYVALTCHLETDFFPQYTLILLVRKVS